MSNPNRVPSGVHTGGRFATSEKAEPADVALDASDPTENAEAESPRV